MTAIGPKEFAELLDRRRSAASNPVLELLDAEVEGLVLRNEELASCVLVRCRFVNVVFESCDLSYSTMVESRFGKSRVTSCNLRKVDLSGAVLRGVDLTGSDLSRSDLTDADLRDAILADCQLDWDG